MAQQTNLNVSPYFDDFDSKANYHKILFKPGYPVQARELTGLQSILQNQVEKFGQHFFKEGAKVIPGNTAYSPEYFAVELNNDHLGTPVSFYIDQLIDRKIIGLTSGVTAIINKVLGPEESERGNLTLYLSYMSAGVEDSQQKVFLDGELLTADSDIISGPSNNAFIPTGESFASCIATNATSTASSFSISNGVYFIRGNFVDVHDQTILLGQYDNSANARIGLRIEEDIINADEDPTLGDNSKGFNNYAAPGADRLKISASLYAKPLDDFNDSNFIELAVVQDGALKSQKKNTTYSHIADELARRTYAESGDYTITPFDVIVKDSLNDNLGNNGVYEEGQFTQAGTLASDDLALYQVGPGKAFVKGYEIETIASTFLDAPKPRTTKKLESQGIIYNTGTSLRLNRTAGLPTIGIGNTYIVSLRDQRVGENGMKVNGSEIGLARVYDHVLESGSYSATNSNVNQWDIALYDVQLTSKITLNTTIDLTVPTFIKGKYSGATGFLKDAVSNSTSLNIYEKSGAFIVNEPIIFSRSDTNGNANSRVAVAVTSYSLADVKSVYGGPELGNVGAAKTFNGDVIQETLANFGSARVGVKAGATGVSVITSENPNFPGTLKVGNILSFGGFGNNVPSYARITAVSSSNVSVTGVTTVTGVVEGELPNTGGSALEISALNLVSTPMPTAQETSLYTLMPKQFISDVDLTDATLSIRKIYNVNIVGGQLDNAIDAGANETWLPFDEERYSLTRADGTTVVLTDNMFEYTGGSTRLQINTGGADSSGCTLTATLSKTKIAAKVKRQNRVNSVVVNASTLTGSGIGATTRNDGLVTGSFPLGTRVQDERIVLNTPDVNKILGVFESTDTASPSAPKMTLVSLNGPSGKTSDLVVGEQIQGSNSTAIATYAETLTDSQITFIVENETAFEEGEVVTFKESKVQGVISVIDNPSRNISGNFTYNKGQRPTFYDYGFLIRRSNAKEPTRPLKVYFSNGYYESTDEGDITTKNSYNTWDYSRDIPYINGERVTDTIDIRPRVGEYTVLENVRSPLEFYGRSFNASGNSATNILASDESITTNFSHYVGRIDRIFLSKDGRFQVQYGDPSEKRDRPPAVDDAIEIASIELAPYLFDTEAGSSLDFMKYKRYRMKDIKDLEDRIKNLEYYTSLSLLETETANMFIPDADGLNQFKSGFFVDNFTGLKTQESAFKIKNSVDPTNKELRAQHYTTSIDLQVGPVEGVSATADPSYETPEGTNIKRGENVVTLDYTEKEWLSQQFATRTESVTPFLVSFWQATLKLTPSSDTWTDTARIKAKIVKQEGSFAGVMAQAMQQFGVDPQTGMAPIQWGAWETTWTGTDFTDRKERRTERSESVKEDIIKAGWINGGSGVNHSQMVTTTTTTTYEDTIRDTYALGTSRRNGTRKVVTEQWDNESMGDKVVNRDSIMIMRSRNVEFRVTKCKPLTQLYSFFDGVNVTKYCTPKLMEVTMQSGTFQVGETVTCHMPQNGIQPEGTDKPFLKARVAQANHRSGPYNAPTDVFTKNPYLSQVGATGLETFLGTPGTVQLASTGSADMPSTYSATTTILNIDTRSLSDEAQGTFFGYAHTGMVIRGGTSGAQATISNLRLISDLGANLIGSYYIPNPNTGNHPKFETGKKTFTIVDNNINDQDNADTVGEESYTATGTLETVQETIVSTRNAIIETKKTKGEKSSRKLTGSSVMKTEAISSESIEGDRRNVWYDPLAQSFQVTEEGGIFITSCEVYFQSKDDMDIPMTFQIRTMSGGVPTQKILPFSEIVKSPADIQVSQSGTIPTKFTFEAPVYLEGAGTEYSIALASWSTKYRVFISRIGESDLLTDEFISQQPYLGSLFKSQNASTWEPSQWEDLKFKIYRADFDEQGTLELYNPILSEGNRQVAGLLPNSINVNSRKVRVGIGTSLRDTALTIGNSVSQQGSNATGNYVGNAGIGTGTMGVVNAGLGYTNGTFTGVGLTNITAGGDAMSATVVVSGTVVSSATITDSGSGFQVGDVLGITSIGNRNTGRNARLSVVSIGNTNELVIDNVQGDFVVGAANTMMFTHPITGIVTTMNSNSTAGGGCAPEKITVVSDGLHFTVDHRNHGMHHETNRVQLSGVVSDIVPTKLTLPYNTTSTASIAVENSTAFENFENVAVGATNPGYVKIGDEVVKYTSVASGSLGGITRGTDKSNYLKGAPVYKYELSGVSLRRINRTHLLSAVTQTSPAPISFDHYTIKIDNSSLGDDTTNRNTGASWPILYANESKSTGGFTTKASQNIPFQIVSPNVQYITVPGTNVTATMRTVSASSLNRGMGTGVDLPFQDQGYEPITLNKSNYLISPRCIASRVNETNNSVLQTLPGDRSFGMTLTLQTADTHLTPVIDLERISALTVSNRIDAPIANYKTDNRVNTIQDDPSSCQYISKENILENSATSIKIMMNAHINEYSDVRAFYAVSDTANFDPIFIPFPGWKNLNAQGNIIEVDQSDGRPDKFVPLEDVGKFKSNELQFREYNFTAKNLPTFKNYRIKFILTSSNQTWVPRVSDLRVITLA